MSMEALREDKSIHEFPSAKICVRKILGQRQLVHFLDGLLLKLLIRAGWWKKRINDTTSRKVL